MKNPATSENKMTGQAGKGKSHFTCNNQTLDTLFALIWFVAIIVLLTGAYYG
ncbi:MAG: hypothetical protein GJU77_01635 [Ferrovum sp.]|jgi:hypothetical protein|nr:hypothetical protein [Ferrovum sp.]NDU89287.1 hypothetical protein [Ferrovum sp.]